MERQTFIARLRVFSFDPCFNLAFRQISNINVNKPLCNAHIPPTVATECIEPLAQRCSRLKHEIQSIATVCRNTPIWLTHLLHNKIKGLGSLQRLSHFHQRSITMEVELESSENMISRCRLLGIMGFGVAAYILIIEGNGVQQRLSITQTPTRKTHTVQKKESISL